CAVSGPPLIVYSAIRRWPRERFKGVLQVFFLVNNLLLIASHSVIGNLTPRVLFLSLACLPGLAAGIYFGLRASRRLSSAAFRRGVLALVVALGGVLALG